MDGARVYVTMRRRLEMTDRRGRALAIEPYPSSNLPDQILDWLGMLVPHLEPVNRVGVIPATRNGRILDFPAMP